MINRDKDDQNDNNEGFRLSHLRLGNWFEQRETHAAATA
jgi:hypothetical protein